ncbi:MAG: hypothetical protein AB1899_06005 [Pseudomonadota bacterium]
MSAVATDPSLADLKARIAQTWARRENLKAQLAAGQLAPHTGLRQLETLDRDLSDLDSRYKALWDATRSTAKETP